LERYQKFTGKYFKNFYNASFYFSGFDMELIRQIKDAEAAAKKLVEEAKSYCTSSIDNAVRQRAEKLSQLQQDRQRRIEQSHADGQKQGLAESQQLKAQSLQAMQQLEQKAAAKAELAVNTVIEFIKNQK